MAGYVPVPLGPGDYIELLPATWRVINSYGIKIARRTYDSPALNPYRRQSSGVAARRGLWEIRYDPYDISRIWVRNHHDQGFLEATWTHLRTAPAPFGELTWTRAREILAAAAATRSPRPRSPPPRRTCSTAPATGRVRAGTGAAAAGRRPHPLTAVPPGRRTAPRLLLPRSGPARHPTRPAAMRIRQARR